MLRGDFTNLSERKLTACLNRLGYDIEIKLKPAAEPDGGYDRRLRLTQPPAPTESVSFVRLGPRVPPSIDRFGERHQRVERLRVRAISFPSLVGRIALQVHHAGRPIASAQAMLLELFEYFAVVAFDHGDVETQNRHPTLQKIDPLVGRRRFPR